MRNEYDKKNLVLADEDAVHGFIRWIPTLVVLCVVGGFFSLSWYAYHAGIESVKDDDLLVIEADKTPMKEKPADPGGMQFPNQDKTIFDTFSANKRPAQNVERILPSPEAPMSKDDADTSETKTWINSKLTEKKPATKEQVFGKQKEEKLKSEDAPQREVISDIPKADDTSDSYIAARDNEPASEMFSQKDNTTSIKEKITLEANEKTAKLAAEKEKVAQEANEKSEAAKLAEEKAIAQKEEKEKLALEAKEKAAKAAEEKAEALKAEKEKLAQEAKEKAEALKVEKEKIAKEAKEKAAKAAEEKAANAKAEKEKLVQEAKEKAEKTEKKVKSAGGVAMVQLGAYRSEEEAKDAWKNLHIKHKDLSDKSPSIVRADLGSKGIYYRLRITGLADNAEANALCRTLSSKGQPCIIPTGK